MRLQLAIEGFEREGVASASEQTEQKQVGLDAAGEPIFAPVQKVPTAHMSLGLPANTVRIAASAFADCEELSSVNVPASLRIVEEGAFERCSSLEEFLFEGELEYLGARAFQHCGFKSFVFPAGITNAPERVLYGCSQLAHVNLGKCIGKIEDSAFARCTSLVSIAGIEWVSEIGYHAFSACQSLERIVLSDSIRVIEQEAFIGCKNLKELVISDCVESIGVRAFAGCNMLDLEKLDPRLLQRFPEAFS